MAGIPKTIDNDLDLIDRSFGFLTAVEVWQNASFVAALDYFSCYNIHVSMYLVLSHDMRGTRYAAAPRSKF